ncbi:hypothetical protein [Candidatus Thiodictyon syntrophicum]|uniref:hypothetical protein n=1 Tax=Candidatus Thiodictyon syntrophicum TaxID=1166950 RepID=UPI0012FE6141|nr:hypothetical protein [Candidatus Thiodictyon syntrophicum]
MPWTETLIDRYLDRWDWERLSKNKALPWSAALIERYADRWNWSEIHLALSGILLHWSEASIRAAIAWQNSWIASKPPLTFEDGIRASNRGEFETAFAAWHPLAKDGDSYAQYNLGQMYCLAHGVEQDYCEALNGSTECAKRLSMKEWLPNKSYRQQKVHYVTRQKLSAHFRVFNNPVFPMSHWLPESLIEMHFHSALISYYSKKFSGKFIRLYKPVPQKEAWVGFDQGWTSSDLSELELFASLKAAIASQAKSINKFYLGEFLQFKVVDTVTRASKRMPAGFSTPYFRSELSLKPNKSTGISQHETLLRLKAIAKTAVFYTCGMVFEEADIWKPADLSALRFVDIQTAPPGWATNEDHFIVFRNSTDSTPMWCSEPLPGISFSIEELAERQLLPLPLDGAAAAQLIQDSSRAVGGPEDGNIADIFGRTNSHASRLPACFSLIEFERI